MTRTSSRSFKLKKGYDLAFSPDSRTLATIGRDIMLWDVAARKKRLSAHPVQHPSYIDFSPDGKRLAVKSTSGRIVIIDAATGDTLVDFANQQEGEGAHVLFTGDGEALVDASWNGVLTVRHATSGAILYREATGGMVAHLVTTTDRSTFAYTLAGVAPSNRKPSRESVLLRRWPFVSHAPVTLPIFHPHFGAIALSPTGSRLAVLHESVAILDLQTLKVIAMTPVKEDGAAPSIGWSRDGTLVVHTDGEGVSIHESTSLRRAHHIALNFSSAVRFSPQPGLVALGSWEEGRVLDIAELKAEQ